MSLILIGQILKVATLRSPDGQMIGLYEPGMN